ncbi:LacI family DNA-binding transcriptional regulator [Pseudomonadota bacterium]
MTKTGIKEVALKAGFSIATVSHAFRNPGRVSDATRKKVLAAAKEVGYSPNMLAASLRTSRSGNIVVIIPNISDNHNGKIIRAAEEIAHSRGYSVLLGDTQGSEKREREFASMVGSRQADGIILMSHRLPFEIGKGGLSIDQLPPIVNGCEFTGHESIPYVAIDDIQAGMDATRHLIDFGHRNIAVITGDINSTSARDRLEGFRGAMSQSGLQPNENLIAYSDYSLHGGETAVETLLLQKNRPSAIFCFSDEIAVGCMYALRRHHFNVPDDISVIGFDDIPISQYVTPPLTTISQPTEEIGAICTTILLDLIEDKQPEKLRHILPHRLVLRESTRRI